MIKLSIIIPVYNVERYLSDCLTSVVNQDIPSDEYEIIVINDGSPDNSLVIAEDYSKQYCNIRIISQENQGLSVARNVGLSLAQGDYIWFVDSDDWIEENCLKEISDILNKNKLDALRIKSVRYINGELKYRKYNLRYGVIITGKEHFTTCDFNCCACYTIYKRDFLIQNNLEFMPHIYHEDVEFSPRAYYLLNRMMSIDKDVYFNRSTPNSIVNSTNIKRSLDLIDATVSIYNFTNIILENRVREAYYNYISGAGVNAAFGNALKLDSHEWPLLIEKVKNNKTAIKVLLRASRMGYKLEGIILWLFPSHSVQIFRALKTLSNIA